MGNNTLRDDSLLALELGTPEQTGEDRYTEPPLLPPPATLEAVRPLSLRPVVGYTEVELTGTRNNHSAGLLEAREFSTAWAIPA